MKAAIYQHLSKHPLRLALAWALAGILLLGFIVTKNFQPFIFQLSILILIWVVVLLLLYYWTVKALKSAHKENKRLVQKLIKQNESLEKKLEKKQSALEQKDKDLDNTQYLLKDTQQQLTAQEKLASIGILAAGIAHEIKNPLNFINNFSDMTVELLNELKEEMAKGCEQADPQIRESLLDIVNDIVTNCNKINEHGKRAESIIKNMLIQARTAQVDKEPIDINALLDEYINLSYHGMRAQNSAFNAKIEKNLDPNLSKVNGSPQSIGRVFLNIINNALYAANDRAQALLKSEPPKTLMPTIQLTTEQNDQYAIVKIRDNGEGIPENIREKIFERFFTTKPAGHGTGLGLPICYDIVVKEHGGQLLVDSKPNEYTEFTIMLPKG